MQLGPTIHHFSHNHWRHLWIENFYVYEQSKQQLTFSGSSHMEFQGGNWVTLFATLKWIDRQIARELVHSAPFMELHGSRALPSPQAPGKTRNPNTSVNPGRPDKRKLFQKGPSWPGFHSEVPLEMISIISITSRGLAVSRNGTILWLLSTWIWDFPLSGYRGVSETQKGQFWVT